jgi:hypothetical protein
LQKHLDLISKELPVLNTPEPLRLYVDMSTGTVWIRYGYCNRCGSCCRTGDPFDGSEGLPVIQNACPFYQEEQRPNTGNCTRRDHSYYLQGCNDFPSHPRNLEDHPDCSYRFLKIGTLSRERYEDLEILESES